MSIDAVDLCSDETNVLLNPRLPDGEKQRIIKAINKLNCLKGHILLATSGSSGHPKLVALSKTAILTSAEAVNDHLKSTDKDIWVNPLPIFHVGGLGIIARCHISGAKMIGYNQKWDPVSFVSFLTDAKATFTSMVPTQIFDLIKQGLPAPDLLRAVIIGGGALKEDLYFKAVKLGWKLLPSYGLTECASQVATAEMDSWNVNCYPKLRPLKHISLETEEGYLKINSKSLLSGYISVDETSKFNDPKVDGWFTTEDRVALSNGMIVKVDRAHTFLKIGGESVNLIQLENIFERILLQRKLNSEAIILAVPDERLGHVIHLVVGSGFDGQVEDIVEDFNSQVMPFERIRHVHHINQIPKSPLGKVLRTDLHAQLKEKTDKSSVM